MNTLTTWGKGQTDPPMLLVCMRQNGQPQDLTGLTESNLSMVIAVNGASHGGNGTWLIKNQYPAIVQYTPAAADFTTIGLTSIEVVITNGSKVNPSLPYVFQVV